MTIDEELDQLDDGIRRLKVEYEIFFNGGSPKMPIELRWRVEGLIKKYGDTQRLTHAQRFRYNSLVAKFNVHADRWRTQLRRKEEGIGAPAPVAETSPAATAAETCATAAAPRGRHVLYTTTIAHPAGESEKVAALYAHWKRIQPDPARTLSLKSFQDFIATKVKTLRNTRHCAAVQLSVVEESGQFRLIAKPEAKPS